MHDYISNIPFLTVKGSPSSMGEQHGMAMREKIALLARKRIELLLNESSCSISQLEFIAEQTWKSVCSAVPHVAEEVEAISFSSKIPCWQLVIAGAYSDISDLLSLSLECLSECTVGIIPKSHKIFGTWDSHYDAIEGALVLKRIPDNGVQTLSLTTVGWPIQFGINSSSLAFGITNLSPCKYDSKGIPYIAAIAHISSMNSVQDAVHWLETQLFISGHSYFLADETNTVVVETSTNCTASQLINEPFVQTNHYQSNIDDNSKYKYLIGSKRRHDELLADINSISNPSDYLLWLNTHPNVLRQQSSLSNIASCATYGLDIKDKCLWISSPKHYQEGMKKISL